MCITNGSSVYFIDGSYKPKFNEVVVSDDIVKIYKKSYNRQIILDWYSKEFAHEKISKSLSS